MQIADAACKPADRHHPECPTVAHERHEKGLSCCCHTPRAEPYGQNVPWWSYVTLQAGSSGACNALQVPPIDLQKQGVSPFEHPVSAATALSATRATNAKLSSKTQLTRTPIVLQQGCRKHHKVLLCQYLLKQINNNPCVSRTSTAHEHVSVPPAFDLVRPVVLLCNTVSTPLHHCSKQDQLTMQLCYKASEHIVYQNQLVLYHSLLTLPKINGLLQCVSSAGLFCTELSCPRHVV